MHVLWPTEKLRLGERGHGCGLELKANVSRLFLILNEWNDTHIHTVLGLQGRLQMVPEAA